MRFDDGDEEDPASLFDWVGYKRLAVEEEGCSTRGPPRDTPPSMSHRPRFLSALGLSLLAGALVAGCSDDDPPATPPATGGGAGSGGAAGSSGGALYVSPYDPVPLQSTFVAKELAGPVDVVRDKFGVPHIIGDNLSDVSFAQGYIMAEDRFIEMDFVRRTASGTLGKLAGDLSSALVDGDIRVRAHHLRATAQKGFDNLKASSDPTDKILVETLTKFAAGVNAWQADLKAGKHTLPPNIEFIYTPASVDPWSEIDSLVLAEYQAFALAFDADSDIFRSQLAAADKLVFADATDEAKKARAGFWKDFTRLAPFDPTHTLEGGWDALAMQATVAPAFGSGSDDGRLALFAATRPNTRGVGLDRLKDPSRGSNNWVIGPKLSASGHTLVANDTHLQLLNPAVFYLVHVTAKNPAIDVMGVQFPGIPLVTLGMNRHVAWGGTVNYIDVTDVYEETVVPCPSGAGPCVSFNGQTVPAVARQETFESGLNGEVSKTFTVTLYDVPHHGPILPRVGADHQSIEALGSKELSVRYTGHESAPLIRAIFNLNIAKTVAEGRAALEKDFKYGGQNWVLGDDQGGFGWTQTIRVPKRAPGFAPWLVLPGDGSAEWQGDLAPQYIPHAFDVAKGFLATANADPIGGTDDGDPFFNEPLVDGSPLYLGSDYDPGTRVGRITKRIQGQTGDGTKLTLDDMSKIQADAITEWGEVWAPVYLDTARALEEELATPGAHPGLTTIAGGVSARAKKLLPAARVIVAGWSFDTPAGVEELVETPAVLRDSQATTLVSTFMTAFAQKTLLDEANAVGEKFLQGSGINKLMAELILHPDKLATGIAKETGDPVLFDDLGTPGVVESRQQIAAVALLEALEKVADKLGDEPDGWRWGKIHTLRTEFFAPVPSLSLPPGGDKDYPAGFPRHGGDGTVDVANHGMDDDSYSFGSGAAIRFTCELDPGKGPRARNILPGGQIFQPGSPHFRDQMELWRKNQTRDLPFNTAEVVTEAVAEEKANKLGRRRFTP